MKIISRKSLMAARLHNAAIPKPQSASHCTQGKLWKRANFWNWPRPISSRSGGVESGRIYSGGAVMMMMMMMMMMMVVLFDEDDDVVAVAAAADDDVVDDDLQGNRTTLSIMWWYCLILQYDVIDYDVNKLFIVTGTVILSFPGCYSIYLYQHKIDSYVLW